MEHNIVSWDLINNVFVKKVSEHYLAIVVVLKRKLYLSCGITVYVNVENIPYHGGNRT